MAPCSRPRTAMRRASWPARWRQRRPGRPGIGLSYGGQTQTLNLISAALGSAGLATNMASDFASGNLGQGLLDSLNLYLPAVAQAFANAQSNQSALEAPLLMNAAAIAAESANPASNSDIPNFVGIAQAASIQTAPPADAVGLATSIQGQTNTIDMSPTTVGSTGQTGSGTSQNDTQIAMTIDPATTNSAQGVGATVPTGAINNLTLQAPLVMDFAAVSGNLEFALPGAYLAAGYFGIDTSSPGGATNATNTGFVNGFLAGLRGGIQGAAGTLSQQLQNAEPSFNVGAFFGLQAAGVLGMLPYIATDGAISGGAISAAGTAGTSTVGEMLAGNSPLTMIHLTPEAANAFAAGVDPGTFFAQLGDVALMTVQDYQRFVVMPAAAAGPGQTVAGFVTAAPGSAGSFVQAGIFNAANVMEYTNQVRFFPSSYVPLP